MVQKMSYGMIMVFILLSALILSAGCGPAVTPVPVSPTSGTAVPGVAKPSAQEGWERTLAEGTKEGKVVIYGTQGAAFGTPVASAFKNRFGIDLEWIVGGGTQLIPKLTLERKAGLYHGDIVMAGVLTLKDLKELGALDPMEPALILPEAKDPKAWLDGVLYFIDKERVIFPYYYRTGATILINTETVRPDDLKSYRNLLEPKWKGMIMMNDPTITGPGNGVTAMLKIVMGVDFLKALARQEPVITRDDRQQVEWVARGKYPILLGPQTTPMAEFKKAGAPIKHIIAEEGTWAGAGGGMIALMNKAAHPNAATVFLNWFLSQEGQTEAVKPLQEQSRRVDVSAEYIDEERRLRPGVKYVNADTEENIKEWVAIRELSKEIFSTQTK